MLVSGLLFCEWHIVNSGKWVVTMHRYQSGGSTSYMDNYQGIHPRSADADALPACEGQIQETSGLYI